MRSAPLRILVFALPPLLDDLVRESLGNQGELVTTARPGELAQLLTDLEPDVLIIPLDAGGVGDEVGPLLDQRMRPVIGIGIDDGRAVLIEFRPHRSHLGEIAPHELPSIVRSAWRGGSGSEGIDSPDM